MDSFELPGYPSSVSLPSYSCDLASGERRLQHTPRLATSRRLTSVYLKKSGRLTVSLEEQEAGVAVPCYGRQALINGSLFLEGRESVLEVVAYVCGSRRILVRSPLNSRRTDRG